MKPDFAFIGPSKSGSTWIFELLRSHPQIYVPLAKDIYFFDRYFEKGFQWYEGFFSAARPGQICGELSHDYLSNPVALQRMSAAYPRIRLICCLRNPYDRAISSYRFIKRNGLIEGGVQESIKSHPEIFEEGLYGKHLTTLFGLVNRARVLVLDFDELGNDPGKTAQKIFSFLGVSADFQSPVIGKRINASASPRSKVIARLVKRCALTLRDWGFSSLVGAIKRSPLVRWLLYTNLRSEGADDVETFPKDMIESYERDIGVLSQLLSRNFDSWRRPDESHIRRS